jgi:dTDP-4-amino-4,6-dideoxygalactose transaminase
MAIQLFVPNFRTEECLEEIRECLEKGWTGLGFKTTEFEERWSEYTGHLHSHFLNSNTAGLHIALAVLKEHHNWRNGDEVLTTPLTFVSTNHAILYNNLRPVFCDVDESLNISPISVFQNITEKTRAIIFVGMGGNDKNMKEIIKICRKNKIAIVLDAAHMAGSRSNGKHLGTFEGIDCAVYSFQAVKNLPTADSGMICFAEKDFDRKARQLSWLGIDKDTFTRTNSLGAYKWSYSVDSLGWKYNGNSIMAAIALVSLKYLDIDNSYRRQISQWYEDGIRNIHGAQIVFHGNKQETSQHLVQVVVPKRDEVILALHKYEIYPGVHYLINTKHPLYSEYEANIPNAEKLANGILSLPCHLKMTQNDVNKVCVALAEVLN